MDLIGGLIRIRMRAAFTGKFSMLVLFFVALTWNAGAQTLTWTDSFIQGDTPTADQCKKWVTFLDQLAGKRFASVTLSGEYDLTGRTISDPDAATQLAKLLAAGTSGVVVSGDHTWTVSNCQLSRCGIGYSISLSVDGNQSECLCSDTYTVRPQSPNEDWGGINTGTSCNAKSQWMRLEFGSAVTVSANGPTDLCLDGSVTLTAHPLVCSDSVDYKWSNGETTPSILVREAGSYTVTVYDRTSPCSATSLPIEVTMSSPTIDAGNDVIVCDQSVRLTAIPGATRGDLAKMVNSVCLFDAPGGTPGMCNFQRTSICLERTLAVVHDEFKHQVSFSNPVELRYKLYYVATTPADFILKVNGEPVGKFQESKVSTVCYPLDGTTMPKTIVVSSEMFRPHWKEGVENEVSVQVISSGGGIQIGGLVTEIVTSSESYSWSPAAGLNSAFVKDPIALPDTSTVYTVTYTDANGCSATDEVKVTVQCADATPVAICQPLNRVLEEGCEIIVPPADFNLGSTSPVGARLTYTVSPAGPYAVGTTEVTFIVRDSVGRADSCKTNITVLDKIPPVVGTLRDTTVTNDPGACWAAVNLQAPKASDNCGLKSPVRDFEGNVFPAGETIVTWTIADLHGNESTVQQKVMVVNAAPEITSAVASASSVLQGRPVSLSISYLDNNVYAASIDWGDGSDPDIVENPEAEFEASHVYEAPGTYSAGITLIDVCDKRTSANVPVVVTNPVIGSVTGGGWFTSPQRAYRANPRASGKATFAFHVSNMNRNRTPEGHIVFNFKSGKLKFHSTGIDEINIDGERASINATGRLNGERDYRMFISVAEQDKNDKGNDKGKKDQKKDKHDNKQGKDAKEWKEADFIRVRISDPSGTVVYDTQFGDPDQAIATTPVGGGIIEVIEKEEWRDLFDQIANALDRESTAYPNPFTDWLDLTFRSQSTADVHIQLLDLSGNTIYKQVFPVSEDGRYAIDLSDAKTTQPGIYVLVIKQGHTTEYVRVVRK